MEGSQVGSSPEMIVEPAIPGDARGLAEVHVRSWQKAYAHLLPAEFLSGLAVERREAMWSDTLARGSLLVHVARVEGRIVGFSACGECRDDDAPPGRVELWSLYALADHWSTGVGRALWRAARETLTTRGATSVSLWVLEDNPRARRFYDAAGFQLDPEGRKRVEIGGLDLPEVRYVLPLGTGAVEPQAVTP